MIPDSEISERPEHEVKSKIGNLFVNETILEEYSVKNILFINLILIFRSITEKNIS